MSWPAWSATRASRSACTRRKHSLNVGRTSTRAPWDLDTLRFARVIRPGTSRRIFDWRHHMRVLALNCNSFQYKLNDRSADIESSPRDEHLPEGVAHHDCLLLFVTVEVGDAEKLRGAAKSIRRMSRRLSAHHLVLIGFAHLSHDVAPIDYADDVLARLEERLVGEWTVSTTPLGQQKQMTIDVRGEAGGQRFLHV